MKKTLIALCLLICATTAFSQTAHHHVVIQLSSNDTLAWKGVIGNIKHLREELGNETQIEVVAHSNGIEFLTSAKTTQALEIESLSKAGVKFVGCENTMKMRKMTKDQLLTVAGTVSSGVAEVVKKEEAGWSYLKAGF